MITCYDCNEDGRFYDLDELINMNMDAQWRAAMGECPVCGSCRTES